MTFTLGITRKFKSQFKKLSNKNAECIYAVLEKLLNDIPLERKYKDHALTGKLLGTRECHVKPDLLLIYKKTQSTLILTALGVGSHSELFGK